jgi:hypothetical protein
MATAPGRPSTAVPVAMSKSGLPIGVQITGPDLEDRTVLKLAELIEGELGGFHAALLVGLVVFVCLFGAILVGMEVSRRLPDHHLDSDSKDVIKLATAVVGTLAALALALLIASARTTYENANAELRTSMARLVLLDRAMAAYGSDTNAARARLRTLVETRLSQASGSDAKNASGEKASIEPVQADLRALSPDTNARRLLQSSTADKRRNSRGSLAAYGNSRRWSAVGVSRRSRLGVPRSTDIPGGTAPQACQALQDHLTNQISFGFRAASWATELNDRGAAGVSRVRFSCGLPDPLA